MKKLLCLLLLLCPGFTAWAQPASINYVDTVLLMSGKQIVGAVQDTSEDRLRLYVPGKKNNPKLETVDLDLVFSVVYGKDHNEVVFYKQDTLFGNYFTPQEVRIFLKGEADARNGFRSPIWTGSSFIVCGTAGLMLIPFVALVTPFAMASLSAIPRVKIKPSTVTNPENLKYDTYILGYEKEARKRRLFRTMISGTIGMAGGIAGTILLSNNK